MIINNHINNFSNLYTANAVIATNQSNDASRNKKIKSFKDEMIISKDAQSFKDMLKKLQGESEVRQEKVDVYDIESENIAASIIANHF